MPCLWVNYSVPLAGSHGMLHGRASGGGGGGVIYIPPFDQDGP